ncbi:MAG: hypothetical protein V3575_06175 [Candidatus Absconditabacteria bacterium]
MNNITNLCKIFQVDNRQEYFENPIQNYFNDTKESIRYIKSYKKGKFLRQVPLNYSPDGTVGYALIRGMNCQAKCHYCYLQTYFKSPDIVRFVNIQDYLDFLDEFIQKFQITYPDKKLIFYDGDFYDSLGYADLKENISQINSIIQLIENYSNVFLEIRAKCLLENKNSYELLLISSKVIYGITFSPQKIIDMYEPGASNLNIRLSFAKYISNRGGKIGVRIDPVIISHGVDLYEELIIQIQKSKLNIDSWNLGELRIKEKLYKYLSSKGSLLVKDLILKDGFYRYESKSKENVFNRLDSLLGLVTHKCMDY